MNDKIDIAITLDFDLVDYPTDDIIYQVFFESAPKCVMSKAHPLAKQDEIHFDSLSTETMIAIDPAISRGAYNNIIQFCERHGIYTVPYHLCILYPKHSAESRSRTGILCTG